MGYFDGGEAPKREERLKACITYGGTLCGLAGRAGRGCMDDGQREFTQGSICLLLPALAMIHSFPDNVTLLHGAVGCGACSHSQNANVRSGSQGRTGKTRDALWISTALNESDVIGGGEKKLGQAIVEADRQYRPKTITVVTGCAPGIIGDDVDMVIRETQEQVAARLIPVHCEGFKTKIWATAYDAVYHGIGKALLDDPYERESMVKDELYEARLQVQKERTVNLMNVSSMGRVDELELIRLLGALDLDANVFPIFANPEEMYKVKRAALSISTCPTHDDYFLKFLEQEYQIPYLLRHMPIGIENTNEWVRSVAQFFHREALGEDIIRRETKALREGLEEFLPHFKGKRVFVSAGEFRALATANLLSELGFEIVGIRSYHHDEFAVPEYEKLKKLTNQDYTVNIANAQPFEEANLLKRLKPDLFLGHWNGNSTASKLGIASHVIYNTGLAYIGYKGAYDLARRLYKQLRNPAFQKNLSRYVTLPYRESWYEKNPYTYIKDGGKDAELY